MTSNDVFTATASAALAAHLVALAVYVLTRRGAILLLLNVAAAAAVLVGNLARLHSTLSSRDRQVLALIGFEAFVLAAAFCARHGRRVPRIFSYLAFSVHLCVSILAVVFALTFRFNRLEHFPITLRHSLRRRRSSDIRAV